MLRYYVDCLQQDWVLCVCYIVQGALLTLPDVALRLFLAENLQFSPAQVQLVYAFMLIPWLSKPLYGFISDTFPIFGYRRFPYILSSLLLTTIFWFLLAFVGFQSISYPPVYEDISYDVNTYLGEITSQNSEFSLSLRLTRIFGLLGLYGESLFICVCGVVVDSIIVEKVQSREVGSNQLGHLQTICTIWRLVGTLLASLISGFIVDHSSIAFTFFVTGCLPLCAAICVCFLHENPVKSDHKELIGEISGHENTEEMDLLELEGKEIEMENLSSHPPTNDEVLETVYDIQSSSKVHTLWRKVKNNAKLIFVHLFMGNSQLWKPALFILAVSSAPSAYTAYYYYLYYQIGVTATQFGYIMFLTSIASLIGTVIYGAFLRRRNIRIVFAVTILLGFLVRLSPELLITGANESLHIPNIIFAISDPAIISVVSQISMMPLIVLGAAVCPKGVEGTLYAFLMSLTEIGGILGDLIATSLTSYLGVTDSNFSNLWLLVLLCNVGGLLPLFLLFLVPASLRPART